MTGQQPAAKVLVELSKSQVPQGWFALLCARACLFCFVLCFLILNKMAVQQPAAKVLMELSKSHVRQGLFCIVSCSLMFYLCWLSPFREGWRGGYDVDHC